VLSRHRFVTAVGASLAAVPVLPSPRAAPAIDALAAAIPGRAAVFAQRLCDATPSIALHASETFPAASVIKLAIMLAVYRAVDAGRLDLTTPVSFDANDVVAGSETFGAAHPGDTAPLASLVTAMIRQSDNTASNALIDLLGFAAINAAAERAGMRRTRLRRYFLHFSPTHENTTSAADVGTLLLAIERGARGAAKPIASRASCRAMIDTLLGQEDREKIAPGLPPRTPLANKTGELPGVRHDAGIVDPYGAHPYVLVVLEAELRDQARGVAGITAIARAVHRAFAAAQNCR
jgi:beta-lactamase class A